MPCLLNRLIAIGQHMPVVPGGQGHRLEIGGHNGRASVPARGIGRNSWLRFDRHVVWLDNTLDQAIIVL